MNNHHEIIQEIFNRFDGKNVSILDGFYAPEVVFQDPVGKVQGLENLKDYYRHAYKNVKSIRFNFKEFISQDQRIVGSWEMHLTVSGLNSGDPFTVDGVSVFELNEAGLVVRHRDYLDLGAMIYERLPFFGKVVTQIKKLLSFNK